MESTNGRGWLLGAGGLLLGLLIGYQAGAGGAGRPNPSERNLDASLWLQTSGEYRALCLQTYRFAGERLLQKLAAAPKAGLPAVIMDLDETVLDNSPFQTWLYMHGARYSDEQWAVWEEKHADEVRLVPGSGDFIRLAESAGVTVFYISNRRNKPATIRALKHVRLNTHDIERRLLLETETGDKSARRAKVERGHRVLMLLGDNLRDFSEEFKAPKLAEGVEAQNQAIAERLDRVDPRRSRFGDDWIVLPNPTYGEWERLIGPRPGDNLRHTTMGQ
jgi:acid phosphatase